GELIVEAGTGTGKTFAYLVPVLLSGARTIVSTGTKTLQEQLFHRDLPRVREALGVSVSAALLKGRANYLCLHRLDRSAGDAANAGAQQQSDLVAIRAWSAQTRRGDIAELGAVPETAQVWPSVTSTNENCLGSECAFFGDCHVVNARRAAMAADVVVVNHHLLFADLALKQEGFGELLPGADVFVIDEAHQLPELAGQFFSLSLSARQLRDLGVDTQREAATVSGLLPVLAPLLGDIEAAVRRLRFALDPLPRRGAWTLAAGSDAINHALDDIEQALDTIGTGLSSYLEAADGLTACHARAQEYLRRLRVLRAAPRHGWVHWFELSERGFNLSVTPLNVAEPLTAFRGQTRAAWVFTSATLAVGEDFTLFQQHTGLGEAETLRLPSPFDFARNALLYLPRGLPSPQARDYTEQVVERLRPALAASRGRAFCLFTSHRALQLAARLLADLPYPLLVQGSAPRALLLDQFRAAGNAVLLGAASFWEGVDVRGDALSLVAIDKLPFAAPDDPILEARLAAIREEGGNPFFDHQLPSAALALRQGVGRLIRAVDDRGVLMLCDPRLTESRYGRIFLNALPEMPRTHDLADVETFFTQ
ncbi:MAG: ATP-dependent DNA helicase, partial [Lysobacterales bacterium]